MRNVLRNLFFSHIFGMTFSMKQDESPGPLNISLFRTYRVMPLANDIPHLVQKFKDLLPLLRKRQTQANNKQTG